MNLDDVRRRQAEIKAELKSKRADLDAGRISAKSFGDFIDSAYAESQQLESLQYRFQKAGQVMGAQEAAFGGELETKAFRGEPKPPTPMDITPVQLQALEMAANARMPFQLEIGAKGGGVEQAWMAGITTKSAVFESNISGGLSGNLPAIQTPYAVGLGYEPTRIAALLPGASMPGPSAAWLSHTANTAEAAGVAEGGTKGDIGPTITENQVKPQKIAGLVSTSLEAWQDTSAYGEAALSSWLPQELTRSLINSESAFLLTATTGSSNSYGGPTNATFNGLLMQSGTLSRAVGSDTPLDAMNKAYIDVRTGSAYAEPDLVIMHPATWGALRREKSSFGTYILDQETGPLGLTADGSPASAGPAAEPNPFSIIKQGTPAVYGSLWGVKVAATTQCPAGTAIVMSVKAGGGIFWTRLGILLQFNPWGDAEWTTNTFSWRVEERVALSVPRPSALNIVTGLPAS
ncbi:phage major capsid protein [Mycobacterium noviomagense]|uniref:Phage capsid-like C-terminal domain-containing protein n=1 Tax=Mycobacterium noviomagense TaxID=459858 RepID=A0A7I7PHY6_9MYCO|nr:phage major capsid protein [Mycobacterium noviomagense]ORB16821.1 hypothetical protein BST37_05900 [Mycobacterium noviomagense]BBY08172.1 hypothetical protein MNVI_34900 [Mycobacterium noviomagense]